jgi:hypothetical protein
LIYFRFDLADFGRSASGVTFFTKSPTASIPVWTPSLTDCSNPVAFFLPVLALVEAFFTTGLTALFPRATTFFTGGLTLATTFRALDFTTFAAALGLEAIIDVGVVKDELVFVHRIVTFHRNMHRRLFR